MGKNIIVGIVWYLVGLVVTLVTLFHIWTPLGWLGVGLLMTYCGHNTLVRDLETFKKQKENKDERH